jgi:uncharacterized membrane protein HdeD (DUF308 family)
MRRPDLDQADAIDVTRVWWVFLVVGLLSLAAGVILIVRPSNSLKTLAVVAGIFLLFDGIIELISSFVRDSNKGLAAVVGVLGIIVGLILIRHPMHGVAAVGIVIGIWLVAAGCVRLVRAFVVGRRPVLGALIAVLEIVAGIIIVADPHIGYTALAIIVGIWLILNGFGTIAYAVLLRGARSALTGSSSQAAASTGS